VSLRVITGKAKGRRLQMVPGDSTRPITDRAKEALFSIIGTWIVDTRVLDLFGGTGAVGIEALSRGAHYAQFVDSNRRAVETIQVNLRHCRLEGQASVERQDAFTWLDRYRGRPFDLVYVAPPQYQELWSKALRKIDSIPDLLTDFGSVIVQIHPREDAPVALTRLEEYDRRRYGSTLLIFYATAEALAASDDDVDDDDETEYDDFDDLDDTDDTDDTDDEDWDEPMLPDDEGDADTADETGELDEGDGENTA
jgi:16S rRNA (guanine(966)-N(2))-methyltransferase RsmD